MSTYDQQSEKVGTNYKPTKPDSKFFTLRNMIYLPSEGLTEVFGLAVPTKSADVKSLMSNFQGHSNQPARPKSEAAFE